MIAAIRRFFDDIHRISIALDSLQRVVAANRPQDVTVHPSAELIDLLSNWRRRQAKKVST